MNKIPKPHEIERLKETYPPGTRVELIEMNDPDYPRKKTERNRRLGVIVGMGFAFGWWCGMLRAKVVSLIRGLCFDGAV